MLINSCIVQGGRLMAQAPGGKMKVEGYEAISYNILRDRSGSVFNLPRYSLYLLLRLQ